MAGVAVDLAVGAREWQALPVKSGQVYSCGPWLAEQTADEVHSLLTKNGAAASEVAAATELLPPAPLLGACGWLSNMGVVLLEGGGSLCYSPVLHPDGPEALLQALDSIGALPVKVVVAPSPAHHMALTEFQGLFPEGFYICGKGSKQRPGLYHKRPDIRFDAAVGSVADLLAAVAASSTEVSEAVAEFMLHVVQDERSSELAMFHPRSSTFLNSDLLYKASASCCAGPGGPDHRYTTPAWYSNGMQLLYYKHSPIPILPTYRQVDFNSRGMAASIDAILTWPFDSEGGAQLGLSLVCDFCPSR